MKIKWDYSKLAQNYNKRPNYCADIIDKIVTKVDLNQNSKVCDVGAGTGYLAQLLSPHVGEVVALEPNEPMRSIGMSDCKHLSNIKWFASQSEQTNMPTDEFDLVSFGSSFNVVDKCLALNEAERISKKNGWFLAIWNHRNLNAPLQQEIEAFIKSQIPNYNYGNRRQDQTELLHQSAFFKQILKLESTMLVNQAIDEVKDAWRSHGTLQKQAKEHFNKVIDGINSILDHTNLETIETPYTSRAWLAQFK
ncbi:MAG: class I SAM-dependent methyltransferase [Marinicella sp.]